MLGVTGKFLFWRAKGRRRGQRRRLGIYLPVEDKPELFAVPAGRPGGWLARTPHRPRACRWDYITTPTELLLTKRALIRGENGRETLAFPADWGPHSSTGRVVDLSPGVFEELGLKTDDTVEVIFPAPEN